MLAFFISFLKKLFPWHTCIAHSSYFLTVSCHPPRGDTVHAFSICQDMCYLEPKGESTHF